MKKIKIGVLGLYRGSSMIRYCLKAEHAELVAICDKWEEGIKLQQERHKDANITYYTNFDEFIKHDMDAVVLANYANEHAPFAIKAMEAGKDVISEVLPVQSMAEAVKLIECCEKTGKIYCYAENYCYRPGPKEIKKAYFEGKLGEFEYGEGEYLHNCEPCWSDITYGDKEHWRNNMTAFFYCTHSVGPLLHMTGLAPKTVTGFECPFNARMARMGAKAGHTAIEMITLENGAILKSLHGIGCSKNSVWYSAYGSKGRMETAREDTENGAASRIYINLDEEEGVSNEKVENFIPEYPDSENAKEFGHGGGDYYCMYNAIEYMLGNENADSFFYSEDITKGNKTELVLEVENIGVAPAYHKIPLYIKLKGEKEYDFKTDIDICKWMPGKHREEIIIDIPENIEIGSYSIEISIYDDIVKNVYFATDAEYQDGWYKLADININGD